MKSSKVRTRWRRNKEEREDDARRKGEDSRRKVLARRSQIRKDVTSEGVSSSSVEKSRCSSTGRVDSKLREKEASKRALGRCSLDTSERPKKGTRMLLKAMWEQKFTHHILLRSIRNTNDIDLLLPQERVHLILRGGLLSGDVDERRCSGHGGDFDERVEGLYLRKSSEDSL